MASKSEKSRLSDIIGTHEADILAEWLRLLLASGGDTRISRGQLESQCREFLAALREATSAGNIADTMTPGFERLRTMLGDISRSRATQGFSPAETATFIFSLKEPLFARIRATHGKDGEAIADDTWTLSQLIDRLGLHTMDVYQRSREEVIARQHEEIAELSTPVVKLWDGILALPLIGTLDSARTQVVMENLLQSIVDHSAEIAIIDITGVPTVDTVVAQHLLKTVAAARLMGADCIVSGIRPQIAQTMVHLGVELTVVSKANLADAFAVALSRTGRFVAKSKAPTSTGTMTARRPATL
ncbi:STAS domain-containing protein [Reyranella sp. CPCC 100927]|uniref:STAS domain-containing protein n=1 Tax=Reyranella sp. CPCC 100927 TaxID=2599616 RepID=UPI0011B81400|nr:STAS domain-containing protein [Reyranella sp. CPCC 100927]TWT13856.1 STAS domain-containing protein [Reyranella sp. CPCC 100927]